MPTNHKSIKFSGKDIEYVPSIQARLIGQSFQPNSLPPHILGISFDFNVTVLRIDEYYESLDNGGGAANNNNNNEEWQKWESFSPMEQEIFQHRIEVLEEQQQALIQRQQKYQQGGGGGGGAGRVSIASMMNGSPASNWKKKKSLPVAAAAKKDAESDTESESESDIDIEEEEDQEQPSNDSGKKNSRWSKQEEAKLVKAKGKGMSWKSIWRKYFATRCSVSAVQSKYYILERQSKTVPKASTSPTTPSKRSSRDQRSAKRTVKKRMPVPPYGKRKKGKGRTNKWTSAEIDLLVEHLEDIIQKENLDNILPLFPLRNYQGVYQRACRMIRDRNKPNGGKTAKGNVPARAAPSTDAMEDEDFGSDIDAGENTIFSSPPSQGGLSTEVTSQEQNPAVSSLMSQRFPTFANKLAQMEG